MLWLWIWPEVQTLHQLLAPDVTDSPGSRSGSGPGPWGRRWGKVRTASCWRRTRTHREPPWGARPTWCSSVSDASSSSVVLKRQLGVNHERHGAPRPLPVRRWTAPSANCHHMVWFSHQWNKSPYLVNMCETLLINVHYFESSGDETKGTNRTCCNTETL